MNILRFTLTVFALILISGSAGVAGSIQVTFTGDVDWTIDDLWPQYGDFLGIATGDSFSSVLTYNPSQSSSGSDPNRGIYSDYSFVVTIQTSSGPVTRSGSREIEVYNDKSGEFGTEDEIHNAAGGTAFIFQDYTHTAFSSGSLADVDWVTLLVLSSIAHSTVRMPNGGVVNNDSIHHMFLRDSGAAIVVLGKIDSVSVQTVPTPVPEPSMLLLMSIGLGSVGLFAYRHKRK